VLSAEIEGFVEALCGGDNDPTLFAQATDYWDALPAAVLGKGKGAVRDPGLRPNAGSRIELRLWLERNRAIGYFANVVGRRIERQVGDPQR
jgi:hypothetical protein